VRPNSYASKIVEKGRVKRRFVEKRIKKYFFEEITSNY